MSAWDDGPTDLGAVTEDAVPTVSTLAKKEASSTEAKASSASEPTSALPEGAEFTK